MNNTFPDLCELSLYCSEYEILWVQNTVMEELVAAVIECKHYRCWKQTKKKTRIPSFGLSNVKKNVVNTFSYIMLISRAEPGMSLTKGVFSSSKSEAEPLRAGVIVNTGMALARD